MRNWLAWRFNGWPGFWLANAVFLVVLLGLGWGWLGFKRRLEPMRARLRRRLWSRAVA